MPRYQSIQRQDGAVVVTIDSIQHRMTVPAFLALMAEGLRVLQSLEQQAQKGS